MILKPRDVKTLVRNRKTATYSSKLFNSATKQKIQILYKSYLFVKNHTKCKLKAKISEKETDVLFQIFLDNKKINNETLNAFYKQNEIEDNYLYKIIQIDASWSKIIRQLYYNRINVNITEIEKENEKNTKTQNFSKESLINSEKNILLNKFSDTHLEKIKKKYLIKFL